MVKPIRKHELGVEKEGTASLVQSMLVTCASACGLSCVRDQRRRLVDGTRASGGEPDLTLRLLADHGRDQSPDRGDEAGRVEEDNVLGSGGVVVLVRVRASG